MTGEANDGNGFFSKLPPIVLGALNNMDEAGETILGTYLYGGGQAHDVYDDPYWSKYMMANTGLQNQLFIQLNLAVKTLVDSLSCRTKRTGRFPLSQRFHAECPENSDFSGYALLHGTNKSVGDFLMAGWADVEEPGGDGAYDMELDMRYVFNDIVDPNGKYFMDRARAVAAAIATAGHAKSYRLSISWGAKSLAEVKGDGSFVISGYPATLRRGVRPLRVATLDWVGAEKKYAEQIETKIKQQLRRNISPTDTASLADRKQRLLWLMYRLSGYMSSIYIARLSGAANHSDELQRLIRERISRELQAELMEALRGKRPQGVEPS